MHRPVDHLERSSVLADMTLEGTLAGGSLPGRVLSPLLRPESRRITCIWRRSDSGQCSRKICSEESDVDKVFRGQQERQANRRDRAHATHRTQKERAVIRVLCHPIFDFSSLLRSMHSPTDASLDEHTGNEWQRRPVCIPLQLHLLPFASPFQHPNGILRQPTTAHKVRPPKRSIEELHEPA